MPTLSDTLSAVEAAQTAYANDNTSLVAAQAKSAALATQVAGDATTLNAAIAAAISALQALVVPVSAS
jgi:hypothetical protein